MKQDAVSNAVQSYEARSNQVIDGEADTVLTLPFDQLEEVLQELPKGIGGRVLV